MKVVVHGRHATGDLSFSPAMAEAGSDRNGVDDIVPRDLEEHMGDSDESDEDYPKDQLSDGEENRSPPRTVYMNTRKCRSDGGNSSDARRLRQELAESSMRNAEVQNALDVLRMREQARLHPQPSNMKLVLTKLKQHPGVAARGPDFIFDVMEYVRHEKDFDYFVVFNDDDIARYLQKRGL